MISINNSIWVPQNVAGLFSFFSIEHPLSLFKLIVLQKQKVQLRIINYTENCLAFRFEKKNLLGISIP